MTADRFGIAAVSAELLISEDGPVWTLAIRRPARRNALSPNLLADMLERLRTAAARPEIGAIVLRGAGDLPFSAGYDFGELPAGVITAADARRLQEPIRSLADFITTVAKPVIGAARRFAVGAALDVFAHCDLRVACHGTAFSFPPARLGYSYPAEGIARLASLIGVSRVTELSLLAEPVTDAVMRDWGFLHRSWPEDEFEDGLRRFAADVATRAPLSVGALKSVMAGLPSALSPTLVDAAYQSLAACLNSADAREGPAALREKRQPVFHGR